MFKLETKKDVVDFVKVMNDKRSSITIRNNLGVVTITAKGKNVFYFDGKADAMGGAKKERSSGLTVDFIFDNKFYVNKYLQERGSRFTAHVDDLRKKEEFKDKYFMMGQAGIEKMLNQLIAHQGMLCVDADNVWHIFETRGDKLFLVQIDKRYKEIMSDYEVTLSKVAHWMSFERDAVHKAMYDKFLQGDNPYGVYSKNPVGYVSTYRGTADVPILGTKPVFEVGYGQSAQVAIQDTGYGATTPMIEHQEVAVSYETGGHMLEGQTHLGLPHTGSYPVEFVNGATAGTGLRMMYFNDLNTLVGIAGIPTEVAVNGVMFHTGDLVAYVAEDNSTREGLVVTASGVLTVTGAGNKPLSQVRGLSLRSKYSSHGVELDFGGYKVLFRDIQK